MKNNILIFTMGLCVICSCKQEPIEQNNQPVNRFDDEYGGNIHITYTCTYPTFTSEGNANIETDMNGKISCTKPAVLSYSVESVLVEGQSKAFVEGNITFTPYGQMTGDQSSQVDCYVGIYDNASGYETKKYYAWDGARWVMYNELYQTPIVLHNGIGFSLNSAFSLEGDTQQIQESTGVFVYKLNLF